MIDFEILDQVKWAIQLSLGVRPLTPEDESAAILSCLKDQTSLNEFIKKYLSKIREYEIIPKKFWDDWCLYVGLDHENMLASAKP